MRALDLELDRPLCCGQVIVRVEAEDMQSCVRPCILKVSRGAVAIQIRAGRHTACLDHDSMCPSEISQGSSQLSGETIWIGAPSSEGSVSEVPSL